MLSVKIDKEKMVPLQSLLDVNKNSLSLSLSLSLFPIPLNPALGSKASRSLLMLLAPAADALGAREPHSKGDATRASR